MLYATRSGCAMVIKDSIYQNLLSQNYDAIPEETLSFFADRYILVPEDEDELTSILTDNTQAIENSHILSHTIQPGANCQLGCDYCGQVHSNKSMSEDHQIKMINRIDSLVEERHKQMHITWYGGEPIMAIKEIRTITPRLRELCERHGMTYMADMVTNGLGFKKRVFEELVGELGIAHFQITLDGTAEFHDQRRYTKKGGKTKGKTFDTIVKNIVAATSHPLFEEKNCSIVVRCNINDSNKENIKSLVWYLASLNLQDKIIFDFQPVTDWGDNNASSGSMSKQDYGAYEIERMMEAIQLGFEIDQFIPTRSKQVCMVVDEKSEVYDAMGNIYSCWELPYTPVYENSKFQYGHLDKDVEKYTRDSMRDWYKQIPTNDTWCKSCKFLPVCGGGCPQKWMEKTPACPSFKFNIEDRLVLEYLAKNSDNMAEVLASASS